jgi:hypothetical protein
MALPTVCAFKGYVKDTVTSTSNGNSGEEAPRIVCKASKPIMQLAKTLVTKISLLPKNTLQPFNIEDDKKQLKFQKDLIRAMAMEMYCMYCLASLSDLALITQLDQAGGAGRCPWQAILKRLRDFINHKTYLPRKVLYDTSG